MSLILSSSLDAQLQVTSSGIQIRDINTSSETDYLVINSSGNISKTNQPDGTSGTSGT